MHLSLLIVLCAAASSNAAGPASPWQVGTPGAGVPGWPYVNKISLGQKTYGTLQAAIDAAPDGATIALPHGVYGLPIKIEKRHGLSLVARDGPALLLCQSARPCLSCRPDPVVLIENSSDIHLENLFILRDVRGDEGELFGVSAVQIDASPNTTLRHVSISSTDGTSLSVSASKNALVEDCVIENAKFGGVVAAVKKDGSGGMTIRSSFIHAKQSPIGAALGDPCDWLDKDVRFPELSVTDSLIWGGHWPSICPQMALGFERNVIVREADWPNLYKLRLEEHNTVVDSFAAAPKLATAPAWRPPPEIVGTHLEAFAVLPPPDDDVPRVGTEWPFCVNDINWPLFPDGPRTLDPYAYPASFSGCAQVPAQGIGLSRVVDRRQGWIRISTSGGGPSRQAQLQVWQKDDRLFTPCMLQSGAALVWTHVLWGRSVQAVDDSHVTIVGANDVCRNDKRTETVEVPKAFRPATARQWTLECFYQADLSTCEHKQ